jgi:hypothetical protein
MVEELELEEDAGASRAANSTWARATVERAIEDATTARRGREKRFIVFIFLDSGVL